MATNGKYFVSRQVEIQEFRMLLQRMGLYPNECGIRAAPHGKRSFKEQLQEVIDRLPAADLFGLLVVAWQLDPYQGMDKTSWHAMKRRRPITRVDAQA